MIYSTATSNILPWAAVPAAPMDGTFNWKRPVKKYRTKTVWEKMISKAMEAPAITLPDAVRPYYRAVPFDTILALFGNYNPIYSGRPKRTVLPLLVSAPASASFMRQGSFKLAGLAVIEPSIPGKRKCRMRLSMNGLMLLDHWAGKHPRFKPFVDAYVPKKAREEIAATAFDLTMGGVPEYIRALHEKAEIEAKKLRANETRDAMLQQMYMAQQAVEQKQWAYSQGSIGQGNAIADAVSQQYLKSLYDASSGTHTILGSKGTAMLTNEEMEQGLLSNIWTKIKGVL